MWVEVTYIIPMNKLKLAFVLFLLTPFIGVQFVVAATCPMVNAPTQNIESMAGVSSMKMMDCHTAKQDSQDQEKSNNCQHCSMCHLVYLETPSAQNNVQGHFVYQNHKAQYALSQILTMDSPPPKHNLS